MAAADSARQRGVRQRRPHCRKNQSLEEKHILRRFWILLFVTAAGSSSIYV